MSLLPKEHGAYGQMAIPLVTSFVVAGASTPALLIAVGVVAAFAAHEPLLVLLGRRGARAAREESRRAARWLSLTSAVAIVAGLVALWLVSPSVRPWFLVPLVPGALVMGAIGANREKSSLAEVAVALVFSLVAVPVCLAAGASVEAALAVGVAFAAVFVPGTLAVRFIILRVRGGGDTRAARSSRVALLVVTSAGTLGLSAAAMRTRLPWSTLIAAAPGLASASWLALFPPPPSRLRTVGWTLVMTSVATAVILMVGLGGTR
jgi:YwiC-like protein